MRAALLGIRFYSLFLLKDAKRWNFGAVREHLGPVESSWVHISSRNSNPGSYIYMYCKGSGLDGTYNSSSVFGVWTQALLSFWKTSREATRRHPNQTNHLSWLLSMQRSSRSTPSSLRMVELLPPSLRLSPATLWRKLISAACIIFFRSLSRSVTIGESWNEDEIRK